MFRVYSESGEHVAAVSRAEDVALLLMHRYQSGSVRVGRRVVMTGAELTGYDGLESETAIARAILERMEG